jgi:hypothetical protein
MKANKVILLNFVSLKILVLFPKQLSLNHSAG